MKKTSEQTEFTNLLDALLRVPHAEIKAKLEAEKKQRKKRKNKAKNHEGQSR